MAHNELDYADRIKQEHYSEDDVPLEGKLIIFIATVVVYVLIIK